MKTESQRFQSQLHAKQGKSTGRRVKHRDELTTSPPADKKKHIGSESVMNAKAEMPAIAAQSRRAHQRSQPFYRASSNKATTLFSRRRRYRQQQTATVAFEEVAVKIKPAVSCGESDQTTNSKTGDTIAHVAQ